MLPIEEVWQRIRAAISPLAPQNRRLADILGLVLAADFTARESLPPFAASLMDGYAVRSGDRDTRLPVVGEQQAGVRRDLTVLPGTAVRIMTGAPLPDGADAVVPFEETSEEAGVVRLPAEKPRGANIRPVGYDYAAGETVLAEGTVVGQAEVGLLAALGCAAPLVYPRPRVAIVATGDELVPVDAEPQPGQIRDSNTAALMAAVLASGCEAVGLPGPVGDDRRRLADAIDASLDAADLLITSGGVSMGTHDFVKPLLADRGEILVGRAALKPGKPLTFAVVRGKPVFGLPGNPVASLVCFDLFVRPALRIMGGHRRLWRPQVEACLAEPLRHDPDRTEFQRVTLVSTPEGFLAHSTGAQGSSRLKSLVGANALLVLPVGCGDFPAGARVTAIRLDQPETEGDRNF
jgi:molybdenum cofactor synthesis domain-containing protein